MADLLIYNDNNQYSENLMPGTANMDFSGAGVITSGSGVAAISNDSVAYVGKGVMVLQSDTFNTDDFVVNFGTRFNLTASFTGLHTVSIATFIDSTTVDIPVALIVYVNGVPTQYDFEIGSSNVEYAVGQWNVHFQNILLTFGQTVALEFVIRQHPFETASPVVKIGAVSLVKQNKNRFQPSTYVKPIESATGWASYKDLLYTSGAPFVINSGVTSVLPNTSGTVVNNQLPTGVTKFYDLVTNKFTPDKNGDYYIITVRFKAKNNNANGVFDFGIDLAGSTGVIFNQTFSLVKGADTEQVFSIVTPYNSSSDFVANGGLPKITSVVGNTSIYDIEFQIDRTHKAI